MTAVYSKKARDENIFRCAGKSPPIEIKITAEEKKARQFYTQFRANVLLFGKLMVGKNLHPPACLFSTTRLITVE